MFFASQLVHSMTRSGTVPPKPVELQPGQVFKGTVLKLYPDNMALVQIGGKEVQAKLETNLEVGQKAWLQVQPSNGVVTLKVLTAPGQSSEVQEATLEGLMRTLGITDTKENRSLVQALVQANLPVGKEIAQLFTAVSKSIGGSDPATVDAFLFAIKRGLPLTTETIAGLKAFLSEKPLSHAIQTFLRQADLFLQNEIPPAESLAAKQSAVPRTQQVPQQLPVQQIVRQLSEKIAGLPLALPEWIPGEEAAGDGAVTGHRNVAPAFAARLAGSSQTASVGTQAASVDRSLQQTVPESAGTNQKAAAPPFPPSDPALADSLSEDGTQIQGKANGKPPVESSHPSGNTAQAGRRLPPDPTPVNLPKDVPGQAHVQANKSHPATERTGVKQEAPVPVFFQATDPPAFMSTEPQQSGVGRANPIQELFRVLGLSHEREILGQGLLAGASDAGKQLENVKSLLLQLSQAPVQAVPASLREAADTLLQHVTGQQLMLVQPSAQLLSQLVMQIPIRTQQGEETAYVQVESKKRAGGQLDPENCRLFFHLQLQQIGATMVDVTIVNRIVNVQVYNDTPWVEEAALQMRDYLAGQLRDVGYQLSGMRVQSIPDTGGMAGSKPVTGASLYGEYKGVDIRI
ncbi:hypothetical protein [Brevibacillus sp. H7]|uniref:hypothetical protein n=1 Tax=Brevibacillus sp. H7 TaxID=3349138 RepID=UPI0038202450